MPHNHSGCMSPRDYFTEQLLTILVCGGLGYVGVQMYRNDMLQHILAPQFHLPVLIGSGVVLLMVVLRAATVWREAGELQPVTEMGCQVNHVHSASCAHPLPGLPGASPDDNVTETDGHTHDMSWVFARMLVLVFPIALFLMGIPNSGFSKEMQERMLGKESALNIDPEQLKSFALDPAAKEVPGSRQTEPDGTVTRIIDAPNGFKIREFVPQSGTPRYVVVPSAGTEMRFNDLADAALNPQTRAAYTGQTAILEGRFRRLSDKEFTLYRLKMTCCGADAVMLKVRIIATQSVDRPDGEWVRVKGVIQFVKDREGRYSPVLSLPDLTDITPTRVKNEYEI